MINMAFSGFSLITLFPDKKYHIVTGANRKPPDAVRWTGKRKEMWEIPTEEKNEQSKIAGKDCWNLHQPVEYDCYAAGAWQKEQLS